MGQPIARRLAAADALELTLYDVDPARADALAGLGRRATSVADAISDADVILTILPADEHVRLVADELAPSARPGQVYADLSTIAPGTIETVASTLADVGVAAVSVSITRGTQAAAAGELALFVSRDEPALRPALQAIASELRFVEGLGAVKALKIANNIVVACSNIAICEALVLGKLLGLTPQAIATHLGEHGAESWVLSNHIVAFVLPGDLGPGHFSTLNMAKDVRLFLELADERGVVSPMAGVAASCYRGTIAAGFGENYHPIVIRWLERIASAATRLRPLARSEAEVLARIARGVTAAQAMASLDALVLLDRFGIDSHSAAGHLAKGSAGNATLASVARHAGRDHGAYDPGASSEALQAILELAEEASAPLFMHEAARTAALLASSLDRT